MRGERPALYSVSRPEIPSPLIVGNNSLACGGIEKRVVVARALPLPGGDHAWTIFVILLILWLLGIVSSYTLGGFIHILLVIAVVVLLINLITGRRPAL